MKAFASAIASEALPRLEKLFLYQNQIGDAGMSAFAGAIGASGALGNLKDLYLFNNQIGDAGMIAFADAIKPTTENPMGAMGLLTVSPSLLPPPSLLHYPYMPLTACTGAELV